MTFHLTKQGMMRSSHKGKHITRAVYENEWNLCANVSVKTRTMTAKNRPSESRTSTWKQPHHQVIGTSEIYSSTVKRQGIESLHTLLRQQSTIRQPVDFIGLKFIKNRRSNMR
jgi:hypothetical protein